MARRLVRFTLAGEILWGSVEETGIGVLTRQARTLRELLETGAAWSKATEGIIEVDRAQLLAPVTTPCQVLCQGQNYAEHAEEVGTDPAARTFNQIFMKATSSITGPYGPVLRPANVRLLDYELEIALVVGKPIREGDAITDDNLHEFLSGIVMANDVSARDIQIPQGQWFKGKSYRTFCPVGPYLVLLEPHEWRELGKVELRLWVNEAERQHGVASQMIFKPAETLSELAGMMDMEPGDLVLTGTPSGVALKVPGVVAVRAAGLLSEEKRMEIFVRRQLDNPAYLQDGDVVRGRIRSPHGELDLGIQEWAVTPEPHDAVPTGDLSS